MARWTAVVVLLLCVSTWEVAARIPMGKSKDCDDAVHGTEIDWDTGDKTPYTCPSGFAGKLPQKSSLLNYGKTTAEILDPFYDSKPAKGPFPYPCPPPDSHTRPQKRVIRMFGRKNNGAEHVCLNTSIAYNLPWPASGNHRPTWPMYGSYKYLPPQRYLHSLEHGGIVGLYNPCAKPEEIAKFRTIIACTVVKWASVKAYGTKDEAKHKGILRYDLSPEIKTPTCLPFVVLAWRNRLMMPSVDVHSIQTFIKKFYANGPEPNGYNGEYSIGLLHTSDSPELLSHCNSLKYWG